MAISGASSSTIVPRPVASPSEAPVGLLRVTLKVSLASALVSPRTEIVTSCWVTPVVNVSVPLLAV